MTHADRDGSEPTCGPFWNREGVTVCINEDHEFAGPWVDGVGCPVTRFGADQAPAGLPLHEATDRDAGTIPSDEERTNDERRQKYATGVLDSYTADQRVDVVMALADAELADAWDEGVQAGMWAERGYPQENPYRPEPTEEQP